MTFVVAALLLLGVATGLNLVLTLGVIRRLREHTERLGLAGRATRDGPVGDLALDAGARPGEFAVITVDGREVTSAALTGPLQPGPLQPGPLQPRPLRAGPTQGTALVGFFAEQCPPCKEWLPRFVKAATGRAETGPAVVLAVVAGAGDKPSALVADLRAGLGPDAFVVREESGGPVSQAFSVLGYPALCRLAPDGTVETTDRHHAVATPVAT